MNGINLNRASRQTLATALIVGAFGGLTAGCLPTGTSDFSRYNAAFYSPNTDSSGYTGTWVFTVNDEYNESPYDQTTGVYQRLLVRLKPISGAPDTYEFTYCGDGITKTTVVATGNTIRLPDSYGAAGQLADFTATANGRLMSTSDMNGNIITVRATRLSGNPSYSAGTVGFDIASDTAGVLSQPTICFSENQMVTSPAIGNGYFLSAAGESDSGNITANLYDSYVTGKHFDVSDGTREVSGSTSAGQTLTSDTHGVRGSVTTTGTAGGSLVLDVKF